MTTPIPDATLDEWEHEFDAFKYNSDPTGRLAFIGTDLIAAYRESQEDASIFWGERETLKDRLRESQAAAGVTSKAFAAACERLAKAEAERDGWMRRSEESDADLAALRGKVEKFDQSVNHQITRAEKAEETVERLESDLVEKSLQATEAMAERNEVASSLAALRAGIEALAQQWQDDWESCERNDNYDAAWKTRTRLCEEALRALLSTSTDRGRECPEGCSEDHKHWSACIDHTTCTREHVASAGGSLVHRDWADQPEGDS